MLVETIEHLQAPWSTLANAARAVAPGGWIVVSTPSLATLRTPQPTAKPDDPVFTSAEYRLIATPAAAIAATPQKAARPGDISSTIRHQISTTTGTM